MGSGASTQRCVTRRLYFSVNGLDAAASDISGSCSSGELKDMLASAAGFSRYDAITLKNDQGVLLPISPALPDNTQSTSYQVTVVGGRRTSRDELLESLKEDLRSEFCNNDKVDEFASKFSLRLNALEKKLEDGNLSSTSESEDEVESSSANDSSKEQATESELESTKSEPQEAKLEAPEAVIKPEEETDTSEDVPKKSTEEASEDVPNKLTKEESVSSLNSKQGKDELKLTKGESSGESVASTESKQKLPKDEVTPKTEEAAASLQTTQSKKEVKDASEPTPLQEDVTKSKLLKRDSNLSEPAVTLKKSKLIKRASNLSEPAVKLTKSKEPAAAKGPKSKLFKRSSRSFNLSIKPEAPLKEKSGLTLSTKEPPQPVTVEEEEVSQVPSPATADSLKSTSFNMWKYTDPQLVNFMEFMFTQLGLIPELQISPATLRKWLLAVRENYHDNPFHNFKHCFSVTQMMYTMVHVCNLDSVFSKLELVLLLAAAASHDLDHPGLSNSYQINAKTELGLKYPESPLENHHYSVAIRILENPETNIFANLSQEECFIIKQDMKDLILSTDLKAHASTTGNFKRMLEEGIDYANKNHKKQVMMMLLKCCDVSNEVRPLEVSARWVECLLKEYFEQSDREKKEGLPFIDIMDREKTTTATAQIGFIKFMLIPTFELMAQLFSQLEETTVVPLRESLHFFERLREKELLDAKNSKPHCATDRVETPPLKEDNTSQ